MNLEQSIQDMFDEHIELAQTAARNSRYVIEKAARLLAQCLIVGGKILSCGNGGSASDSLHFTAEIANRFRTERDGLAAVSLSADVSLLTAIGNDYGFQYLFSRQIKALGNKGDTLLAISTSGNSENMVQAVHMAHECNMRVIYLSGNYGGKMRGVLTENDIDICIESNVTSHIQEMHILVIHCLCDLIDKILIAEGYL